MHYCVRNVIYLKLTAIASLSEGSYFVDKRSYRMKNNCTAKKGVS